MHYLRDSVSADVAEIYDGVSTLAFPAGFFVLPDLHIDNHIARLQKRAHALQLGLLFLEAGIIPSVIREHGNALLRNKRQMHGYAARRASANFVSDGVKIGFVGECRAHRMVNAVRSCVLRRLLYSLPCYAQTFLSRYERGRIILNAVRFQIICEGRLDDSLPANLRIVPVDGDRISARSVHRHRSQQGDNQASPQKTHCIFFHLPKPFVFQIRLLYHSLQIAARSSGRRMGLTPHTSAMPSCNSHTKRKCNRESHISRLHPAFAMEDQEYLIFISRLCTSAVVGRPQLSKRTPTDSGVTPHANFDSMPSILMVPSTSIVTMA